MTKEAGTGKMAGDVARENADKLRELNKRSNKYTCLVKYCGDQKQARGKLCPFHSSCARDLAFDGVMNFVDQVYAMDDPENKYHSKETKRQARYIGHNKLEPCNVDGCLEIHNVMYTGKCVRHHQMYGYLTDAELPESTLELLLRFDAKHGSATCSMSCTSVVCLD